MAAVAFFAWYTGGRYVSTDNAYVHAPKLVVSADVSGIVADVLVHEGQAVRKGDVLFRIDPRQFQIAVDNAKAQLAQTALNLQSMREDYQRMLSDAAAQAGLAGQPSARGRSRCSGCVRIARFANRSAT